MFFTLQFQIFNLQQLNNICLYLDRYKIKTRGSRLVYPPIVWHQINLFSNAQIEVRGNRNYKNNLII